jgi:predicted dehydrogenase
MPNVRREAFAVERVGGGVAHEVKSEDLASVLLCFNNGARGAFSVGQALPGHKNDLKFEICGRKASVSWAQERAHELNLAVYGEPKRTLEQEFTVWGADAKRYTRLPPGHHQGWADSFRNIIADAYHWIGEGAAKDKRPKPLATFQDGYRSGRLIETMLLSARKGGVWTPIPPE